MLTELRELFGYNDWANVRVIGAVDPLTPDQLRQEIAGSFPSLWATLTHIYVAEQSWFIRWNGTPEGLAAVPTIADFAELHAKWDDLVDKRRQWLSTIDEDAIRRSIAIRLRSGLAFEQQLAATMRHVVNHSTYHRGQITNFLRHLGGQPIGTDLVTYYIEHPPA